MKIKLSQTGRRLSVLVGILTTMIASGCASQKASQDPKGIVAQTVPPAFYTLTVNFDDNGCPTSVSPPPSQESSCGVHTDGGLCAKRGDLVMWVSNPAGTKFEVYFDPFVGRPYKSLPPQQKTSPKNIDMDSMKGKYEYSVWGNNCSGANPVLDPPIRVEY